MQTLMTSTKCQTPLRLLYNLTITKCHSSHNECMKMEVVMYKNRAFDGKNNISGHAIAQLRKRQEPRMSQRQLAEKLQLYGIDLDKNAIQRIESGQRFVTDIELNAFSKVLQVPVETLLNV